MGKNFANANANFLIINNYIYNTLRFTIGPCFLFKIPFYYTIYSFTISGQLR